MRRTPWLYVLSFTCLGCTDRTPARVMLPSDTLVVNTTLWLGVEARVVNASGAPVPAPALRVSVSPESVLAVSGTGAMRCRDDGVGTLVVVSGAARAQRPVRCHVVRRFGPTQLYELVAGRDSVPLVIQGFDRDGRELPALRLPMRIDDTTVIQLRRGWVRALRPGFAGISTQSSGRSAASVFFVTAADTTGLPPCESPAVRSDGDSTRPCTSHPRPRPPG